MVTNLDEKGNRMGPAAPPPMEPPVYPEYKPEPVVVQQEPEEEPPYYPPGMPYSPMSYYPSDYYYGGGYYPPYYPVNYFDHGHHGHDSFNRSVLVYRPARESMPPQRRSFTPVPIPGSSAGTPGKKLR